MTTDDIDLTCRESGEIADWTGPHTGRRATTAIESVPETDPRPHLGTRFESLALDHGAVGRLRCAPDQTLRLPEDFAGGSTHSYYVLHPLAGEIGIAQAGQRTGARAGDILVLDGALPARITLSGAGLHDLLTLALPAARLSPLAGCDGSFGTLHLVGTAAAGPLPGILRLVADHMRTASREEVAALIETCGALLAAAVSRLEVPPAGALAPADEGPLLKRILDHTNSNIADSALAAPGVAQRFGISVRYLHKLFAASGVTFGSYVAMRRLDHVHGELTSGRGARRSIAALAFKWGFRDLSTFNRAFRKRFGCTPRRLRARAAH